MLLLPIIFVAVKLSVGETSKATESKTSSESSHYIGLEVHHGSCSFDSFDIPCKWKNKESSSSDNLTMSGTIDDFEWNSYSRWIGQKILFRFSRLIYQSKLLLALFVDFRRKSSGIPDEDEEKNTEIDLSVNYSAAQDKFKFEINNLQKTKTASNQFPIFIGLSTFYSPVLYLAQEGCFKFKMRGNTKLSNSDSLLLWSKKNGNRFSNLIWSFYGPPTNYWQSYSIGIMPGNFTFSFNGSIYLTTRTSMLMFLYEVDDIEILPSKCENLSSKNGFIVTDGLVNLGLSSYSNRKCKWVPFTKFGAPISKVKIFASSSSSEIFEAKATHLSNSGINVCVTKQTKNSLIGWNNTSVCVNWAVQLSTGIVPAKRVKNSSSKPETYEMPTLPNEGQIKKKIVFEKEEFDDDLLTLDECSRNEFQCASFRCIPASLRCDGNFDCSGGEDEKACPDHRALGLTITLTVGIIFALFIFMLYYRFVMKRRVFPEESLHLLPTILYNSAVERENIENKHYVPQNV